MMRTLECLALTDPFLERLDILTDNIVLPLENLSRPIPFAIRIQFCFPNEPPELEKVGWIVESHLIGKGPHGESFSKKYDKKPWWFHRELAEAHLQDRLDVLSSTGLESKAIDKVSVEVRSAHLHKCPGFDMKKISQDVLQAVLAVVKSDLRLLNVAIGFSDADTFRSMLQEVVAKTTDLANGWLARKTFLSFAAQINFISASRRLTQASVIFGREEANTFQSAAPLHQVSSSILGHINGDLEVPSCCNGDERIDIEIAVRANLDDRIPKAFAKLIARNIWEILLEAIKEYYPEIWSPLFLE